MFVQFASIDTSVCDTLLALLQGNLFGRAVAYGMTYMLLHASP